MFHELCWSISSQGPWTQLDLARLAKYFDQTTLSLVRVGPVTTGPKDITQRVPS